MDLHPDTDLTTLPDYVLRQLLQGLVRFCNGPLDDREDDPLRNPNGRFTLDVPFDTVEDAMDGYEDLQGLYWPKGVHTPADLLVVPERPCPRHCVRVYAKTEHLREVVRELAGRVTQLGGVALIEQEVAHA